MMQSAHVGIGEIYGWLYCKTHTPLPGPGAEGSSLEAIHSIRKFRVGSAAVPLGGDDGRADCGTIVGVVEVWLWRGMY